MRLRAPIFILPAVLSGACFGCSDSEGAESSDEGLETPGTASDAASAGGSSTGGNSVPGASASNGPPSGAGGATAAPLPLGSGGMNPGSGGAPAGTSTGPEQSPPLGGSGPEATPGGAGTPNVGSGGTGASGGAGEQNDPAAGGMTGSGGATAMGASCTGGQWPASDPSEVGPFEVVMEEDVGPEAGEPEEDGTVPRFTLFRPDGIADSGLCHPVITWGNGTGSTPNLYGGLLRHLTSHGFVVIGSNSTNVSRGDPKPMNVGIDWVLEQNADPSSVLYQRLDTAHIGATGHSQGAMATSQASSDERIVTSLPIEGASVQRDLHGPAMFFCGGLDDIVGCDGAMRALDEVSTLPAMYANYLTVDHGSWLSFGGNSRTDVEVAITAWMRVHLMADQALRSWFYGAGCELCTNPDWEIDRKNMGE